MTSRASARKKRARERAAEANVVSAAPAAGNISSGASARRILYAIFALSGLTGLVYEATWTRYLQLFLGHAAYAQVLVLSLFMGGMAIGALIASRLARATISPLHVYAACEALLGVAAIAFHPLFAGVTAYAYETLLPGSQGSAGAQAVQWLLAGMLVLPQSILLGMTFPLMSASVLRRDSERGGRVFAMLYFTNSAGAVVGVLVAGFWLVEAHGLQMTMTIAGGANLLVAAIAAAVASRERERAPALVRPPAAKRLGVALLAFAFATGAASFLYEIAWLRMLALVQGSSTHAFETMLSAFILGLALGGLWVRGRIEKYRSPLAALARVQLLMGLAALATLPAYDRAFDVMAAAMAHLPRNDAGYLGFNVIGYLISAVVMVPASFFAGMTLPLLTYVLYAQGRGEAEIGAVYGWNTLGGIAGTVLGALVLMPAIGVKNVLVFGAGIDIALGIVLTMLLFRRNELPALRASAAVAATAVVALLAAVSLFEIDVTRSASGVFRSGRAQIIEGSKVAFHADGRTATVDVIVDRTEGVSIATNGKVDAEINMKRARGDRAVPPGIDEYTMVLLGALPLRHAPDARRVAIVGHGSGLTTHTVLASPNVEQVDVVEIEPEMIRGARAFLPRVERAYADPRVRYQIEDARAFFARSAGRYDVIISEPSNPWVSGVASLFTPEFYAQARRALNPNGLFVQWFHTYEMDRALVASIVRGIGMVFSDYVLYAANDSDAILVATVSGAIPPRSDAMFRWPAMRDDLQYLAIRSPNDLDLFRVASRRAYAPLLETGRVNSDFHPYLEFGAARARFVDASYGPLNQMARDPMPVLEMLSGFDAPRPPGPSPSLARIYPRFLDAHRAATFERALAMPVPASNFENLPLSEDDRELLRIVHRVPGGGSADAWETWFAALFAMSKAMIPNGGAPALARYVATPPVADALRSAPAGIPQRVAFLELVGARDIDGIRKDGVGLLQGSLRTQDPIFYAYVYVATTTACLARAPDDDCRAVIAQLDRVAEGAPVIDVLRAHRAALRPASVPASAAPR